MKPTNKTLIKRGQRRVSASRAFTVIELVSAFGVLLSVLTVVLSLSWHSVRALDRQQLQTTQGNNARTGVDEMLAQLRYANEVRVSQVVNSTTFTTGTTSIVVAAQGYNPATSAVFLPGITDYIAFKYDATTKKLTESCLPGTGSVRKKRTSTRIASGVSSVTLTYRARNEFVATSSGAAIYTLSANATSNPIVMINGVASTGIWTTLAPKVITVNAPAAKANIQVVYPVSPTALSGDALQYVKQVDVNVNFEGTDSRKISRTLSMVGSARLRNQRK